MPGWRRAGMMFGVLLVATAALADDPRPSWECLPDDTVLMVRLPQASAFVEAVRNGTKFGAIALRPDRLDGLWEFVIAGMGPADDDSPPDIEEALRKYGLEIADLLGAGDHDMGGALVVRGRDGLPALAMILGWAEPGEEAASKIMEAAKRRIEELQDGDGPGLQRIDLTLSGYEVISVIEPVMGLDLRGLELDALAAESDSTDSEELANRLEQLREKVRSAKPVQTGQTHSYLMTLGGRLVFGSTIQTASPVRKGGSDPADFEPRCGSDDSREIFEAFLAAHADTGEPALARVLAEPAIAAARLPTGVPLAEVVCVPQQLIAAAAETDAVGEQLARLGTDDIGGVVWRHAFIDGCWRSSLAATLPAPRHGLFSILDQQCDASDVPSFVTSEIVGFTQISLDLGAAFRTVRELLLAEPDSEQLANMLMVADVQAQTWLGSDVATVLTGLGSRHWVLSFPPRIAAALAFARQAAQGGAAGDPATADNLALVWEIEDETPFVKLLGRLSPLAGGELQEEQGFRGVRVPGGGAAFVGRGHLVLAVGDGMLEKTLSAIRNPPSGEASLRESAAVRRARELMPLPPARMFGITDATRTGGTLGMFRDLVAGLEPDDVEDAYRDLLATGQKLLPTQREMEGMFGVGGTVLRMTDDGIVFETVWELPPP